MGFTTYRPDHIIKVVGHGSLGLGWDSILTALGAIADVSYWQGS